MNEFGLPHIILIALVLYFFVRPILGGYREGRAETVVGPLVAGQNKFEIPVVGESHYQGNLLALCGSKTPDGVEKYFVATLVPENANPHDPNAIRVDIDSMTVGYLSRNMAKEWRRGSGGRGTVQCRAVVRGGWDRGASDKGSFGVWLDLPAT